MSRTSSVRRVAAHMDRARGRIAAAAALGAVAYVCAIGLLAVAAWLIARASQQPPVLTLTVAAVSVRAFAIGRSVFRYTERLVGHDGAFRGLGSLRVLMYERLERQGPARTGSLGRGDLMQRMVGDVDAMQDLPLRVVLPWTQAGIVAVLSVAVAWWLLPAAGVVMLVGLLVAATAVPALAMRAASDADDRVAGVRGQLSAAVLGALESAIDLRSIGATGSAMRNLAQVDEALVRAQLRSSRGAGLAAGVLVLVQGAVIVASAAAGVVAVADARLDGVLLAVVVLLPLAAFEASLTLPTAALAFRRVRASADRISEVLDAPGSEPRPVTTGGTVGGSRGLELLGAHVRWPGATRDALHGIDLKVQRGESVAVVGPSGSGKSTVAAALVRFLDVAGTYLLDGVDASAGDADDVRRRVGLLAQEAHVFDTTLEQNLRLVRPDAADAELVDVLERVRLNAWVNGLPRGLDEEMGEGGVRMSGGQRQRIGLARMLLADFDWVVLDEPTENLDTDTSSALMDDIVNSFGDQGLVLITHRMSDAMRCDRVVVLHEGLVAAEGAPAAVLVSSEWFAEGLRLEHENDEWDALASSMPVGQVLELGGRSGRVR